jgi:hypothetical protein
MRERALVCYDDVKGDFPWIFEPEQRTTTRSGGMHSDDVCRHAGDLGRIAHQQEAICSSFVERTLKLGDGKSAWNCPRFGCKCLAHQTSQVQ